MNKIRSEVFLLIILACIVRLFVILNFDNKPGDSVANVEHAVIILENPRLINFDANSSML
jgi:hypothetical protein